MAVESRTSPTAAARWTARGLAGTAHRRSRRLARARVTVTACRARVPSSDVRFQARPAIVTAAIVIATTVSVASAATVGGPAQTRYMAWRVDPPPYVEYTPDERAARELVDVVNALRAEASMPPLLWHDAVAAAAQQQSDYQARIQRLSHTGPDGSDTGRRLTSQGFAWIAWGENVGAGFTDVRTLLNAWTASPDHREHLIGEFRYAGVGIALSASGAPYWTLVVAI